MMNFNAITGICKSMACQKGLLVDEQHRLLARILPWLYLMIVSLQVISWARMTQSSTHIFWHIFYSFFTIFSIYRGLYWWIKRPQFESYTLEQKKKDLKVTAFVAPAFTTFFSSFLAYNIVSTGSTSYVFLSMSLIALAIVGSFSLFSLPVASVSSLVCSIVPIAGTFLFFSDEGIVDLGRMLLAIMVFGIFLLLQSFRHFSESVQSHRHLEDEQKISKRTAASVERLAFYDALTDLPNRRKFVQLLSQKQRTTQFGFAVGVLGLEDFKSVEEIYGRAAGDALLRQVSSRLVQLNQEQLDSRATFARLSDEEFVFFVPRIENVAQAFDFGTILCGFMDTEFELFDSSIKLDFSCGLALYPYSDNDPSRLITRAKLARKQAVLSGEKSIGVFSLDMELAQLRRTKIEKSLSVAVENSEITPVFQPIVRINDGGITGFEALARWKDGELGQVPPDEFIEIAEQSQLIEQLTLSMFEQSLAVVKTWPSETKLFFNLSTRVLARQHSIDKMLAILKASGVSASRVDIELTETAVMEDIELAKQKIAQLKQAGFGIALDDFGSGYSSLGQIRDLPLDKVKIDKSFTDKICSDDKMRKVVGVIIQLCQELDIACVVEGIEDEEQLGILSDMNCDLGQGYLFSPPIVAEKTTGRLLLANAA